jgi:hypothetical protein
MVQHETLERLIGNEVGHGSRLTKLLITAVERDEIEIFEAQAIARAVRYSGQIADTSIGNIYREELANLTKEA